MLYPAELRALGKLQALADLVLVRSVAPISRSRETLVGEMGFEPTARSTQSCASTN